MKLLKLLPIFLLFLMNKTNAQTQPSAGFGDCITYKNGSLVYGKVIYYVPTDTLRFQLSNGQILLCPPSIIQKVVMAKPKTSELATPQIEKPYNFKEHGFYGAFAYAMSFGRDRNGSGSHIGVGLQASAGHLFQRKLGVGGGLAYDSYYLKDGNANVLAAFGEVRGYLSKRRVAEFFTLAAGFGQPMKTDNTGITKRSGGFLIQPTIGLRLGASARYNFFVELGARFQQVNYAYSDQWIENKYKVTYQRWIFRGGIVF
jgi:hypothetical protein